VVYIHLSDVRCLLLVTVVVSEFVNLLVCVINGGSVRGPEPWDFENVHGCGMSHISIEPHQYHLERIEQKILTVSLCDISENP
jgi:hypothetical protein